MVARYGVDQNEEFKKIEKLHKKAIRMINFIPLLKCSSWKTDVWNEHTKTKGLHQVSKYLICKRLLEWNKCPGSFNKFHPSKLPLNHTHNKHLSITYSSLTLTIYEENILTYQASLKELICEKNVSYIARYGNFLATSK